MDCLTSRKEEIEESLRIKPAVLPAEPMDPCVLSD